MILTMSMGKPCLVSCIVRRPLNDKKRTSELDNDYEAIIAKQF